MSDTPDLTTGYMMPDDPAPAGYGDKLIDARLAGHGWVDVDKFVNQGTTAALAQGYTQPEVNDYLGLTDPTFRMAADASARLSTDDKFANGLKNTTAPLAISPLEGMSADRMQGYASWSDSPPTRLLEDDKPLAPSGIDLNDSFMRNSYARSLFDDGSRSPLDFAERYTGALGTAGADPGSLVRAAGELADRLPSDRDFTDQAIAIAHSSGVALTADGVKTVRNNLIDHWTETGQPLQDTYKQAYTDPELAAQLTTEKKPDPDALARFYALPGAVGEFLKGAGLGLTSGTEELKARVDSGEISNLAEALGATVGHIPAGMIEGMWSTAKRAGEALMGGDPLTPEEAVNAAAFGLKFKPFRSGEGVVPQATVLDPAAAEGQAITLQPGPSIFGEKARTVVDTLSNAASKLGDIAGNLKDRFHRQVAAQLADDIHVGEPPPGTEPITVWHASPHDFDRFDISKVGTGEGNAGHGSGMHFAENPEVHEYYKKQFTTQELDNFDPDQLSPYGRAQVEGGSPKKYFDNLVDGVLKDEELPPDEGKDYDYLGTLPLKQVAPGNSYKVNLHVDPDKLLKLDEPLSGQSETVKSAVNKLYADTGMHPITDVATGEPSVDFTGREFYDDLKHHFGGGNEGEAAASQALQKAGLDGTKYLDGESRDYAPHTIRENIAAWKEQLADPETSPTMREHYENLIAHTEEQAAERKLTHNYVIFDDAKMDMLERNGNPVKPADVAQQVDNVAQGQRAAQGVFGFAKQLGLDVLKDESGSLNLFRTPQQQAERAAYTDSRDFMRPLIMQMRSRGDQVMAHFADQLDHWKTAAGNIENVWKLVNKHMPEWEGELDKGINGNPMGTFIGNMISYIEGRSMGAAIRHDSPLASAADAIRYINQSVRGMLEDGFNRGIINYNSYFEDYFRHLWEDPNRAQRVFEEFQARVGKLGSSSGLQLRSLPTIEDGLKMGLKPVIRNPLELTRFDAGQKIKYLNSAEILDAANKAGYVHWRTGPQGDEVPLNSHRTFKGIPNNPQGLTLQAYANPGAANAWNDWISKGFHQRPGLTSSLYDKMLYSANTMNGISLAFPAFHFLTEVAETWTSGIAHAMSLLGNGHVLEAAKEAVLATPPISTIRGIRGGGQFIRDYNNMIPNPAIRALVDAGARFGPRQEIYKMGSAPSLGTSLRRGSLVNEWREELNRVIGDPNEPPGYRATHAPLRALGMAAHETGRVLNTVSGPLFDQMIPRLKAYNNVRQMDAFLRDNPTATPEQISQRAQQITRNTDERLGEMNMDNVFWPKAVKQTAQLGMISLGWVYGWVRLLASAAQMNPERGFAFERNPLAVRSLVAFTAAYAMENMAYQYLKTGQAPFSSDTPIKDMFAPRTGGMNQWGTPERALLPSQAKELLDYYKVGAYAAHDPALGLQEAWNYAKGKGKAPVQFLMGLATGKDAVGNDIGHTAGGWTGFLEKGFQSIFLSSLDDRKKGTEISPMETMMGLHPMTKAAQDPAAFYKGLWKQDRRLYKQQQSRAKYENKIYIKQRPIPVDPEAGGNSSGSKQRPTADQMRKFMQGR